MSEPPEIELLLHRLAAAPARFAAAFSRLEDADSVVQVGEGEWSPEMVLAHVRASCDIMEARLLAILARDNPPLPAYDDVRWAGVARYASLPVVASLDAMRLRRAELVRALAAIAPEDWQRTGLHEVQGSLTLLAIARHIAGHEDEHIGQIEQMGGEDRA